MPRPKSPDPKQRLTVFLPSSVLARITERAAAKDPPVSAGALVGRMVERAFAPPKPSGGGDDRLQPVAPPPDATRGGISATAVDEDGRRLVLATCKHPKKAEKNTGYAVVCGACGVRLR